MPDITTNIHPDNEDHVPEDETMHEQVIRHLGPAHEVTPRNPATEGAGIPCEGGFVCTGSQLEDSLLKQVSSF